MENRKQEPFSSLQEFIGSSGKLTLSYSIRTNFKFKCRGSPGSTPIPT